MPGVSFLRGVKLQNQNSNFKANHIQNQSSYENQTTSTTFRYINPATASNNSLKLVQKANEIINKQYPFIIDKD